MVVAFAPAVALGHPSRIKLHAAVKASPGITFRALSRQVGIPVGTTRHHLTILIRSGLLREERVGCAVAFLPADDQRNAAIMARLREPGMAALRNLVGSAGRVCQRDLLAYLDGVWPRSTVQHRLDRLVATGVLRVMHQGRYRFYEVAA